MTATYTPTGSAAAVRFDSDRFCRRPVGRAATFFAAAIAVVAAACTDSNIPFYNQPTGVANTQGGIQNAMTGLLAASRVEVGNYISNMSQFSRDEGNIQFDNPQNILTGTGAEPIPAGQQPVWDNEYRAVGAAIGIIAAVPTIQPAFTAQQAAAIIGVAQTIEALDLMAIAETRDTLGIPIHTASNGTAGPVYCNKDVWAQIVALLDTANVNLNTAGAIPLPVKLPAGFKSVSASAGPSTVAGSFASFNRALAGKANLELAYAIARNTPATHPTPTTPGTPDAAALTRADSAITASALFSVALTPPAAGGFTESSAGVFWDWSAQSGDLVNPINQQIGIWRTLSYLVADVDTINDLRFKGKFAQNTFPLQIPADGFLSTNWLYFYYPGTASPIPIVRNEGLVLYRAQVQLGLGNLATAIGLINQVHQQAGGFASPLSIAATYTAVRDSLLKEQRVSTVFEAGGDRTISLRMYHLETVADTTWNSQPGKVDLHTTVIPIPTTETGGRGGNYTLTCS